MSEFTAAVWQEDDLFIAQCLEVDVASQGHTEEEALVRDWHTSQRSPTEWDDMAGVRGIVTRNHALPRL